MKNDVVIRKATTDDASFIVWGMAAALEMEISDPVQHAVFMDLVKCDDVLYSWTHSFVACLSDGSPVGLLIAYEGTHYREMRKKTFDIIRNIIGTSFDAMDDETRAGEYYIDSLAVIPAMRGRGIGTALLRYGIAHARHMAVKEIVLAVSPDNQKAQRLYRSLGFREGGTLHIFGEDYWRWFIKI